MSCVASPGPLTRRGRGSGNVTVPSGKPVSIGKGGSVYAIRPAICGCDSRFEARSCRQRWLECPAARRGAIAPELTPAQIGSSRWYAGGGCHFGSRARSRSASAASPRSLTFPDCHGVFSSIHHNRRGWHAACSHNRRPIPPARLLTDLAAEAYSLNHILAGSHSGSTTRRSCGETDDLRRGRAQESLVWCP